MITKSTSGSSRPSSITRCSRESYTPEFETLPAEGVSNSYELDEEVLEIEDFSDGEQKNHPFGSYNDSPKDSFEKSDSDFGITKVIPDETEHSAKNAETKMEKRIRKGLEKVKQLDEILNEKVKEEKEVKRSRYALQRQFQSEVAELIQKKGADKVCGSQQLIHLCASADRPEEIEEFYDSQPIFHTQIDAEYYTDKVDNACYENAVSDTDRTEKNITSEVESKPEVSKKSKDFVKRNIQLASQAQEIVPLTEEEKIRLDELLADSGDLFMVENPFSAPSITLSPFQFTNEESRSLELIDKQLNELVPVEELSHLIDYNCDAKKKNDTPSHISDFDGMSEHSDITLEEDGKCGEKVLQDRHDERIVAIRLNNIETRLTEIRLSEENETSRLIDPDLLRKLLDVDSRLTSDNISICDSLKSSSSVYSDVSSVATNSVNGENENPNSQYDIPF